MYHKDAIPFPLGVLPIYLMRTPVLIDSEILPELGPGDTFQFMSGEEVGLCVCMFYPDDLKFYFWHEYFI